MEQDLLSLQLLINKVQDPEMNAKLSAELVEKLKAVHLLRNHYRAILSKIEAING